MRTTCLYLLWAAVLPASSIAGTPADSLTLQDIVRLTVTNQPQIMQVERSLAAADARINVSRAAMYPEVEFLGDYTRIGPVASITAGGVTSHLYPDDNYDLHVEARQTLYDFGKRRTSIAIAEATRQAMGNSTDLIRLNLSYQAATSFNNVLILQNTIVVIDSQLSALQQHEMVSTKRIQAGSATNYDTLTTQVRIAVATNDRTDAVRALNSQLIALHELTGLPDSVPLNLKGDFAVVSPAPQFDSLIEVAEKQRPELTVAQDGEHLAEVQAQLAGLGDRPSISLAATSGVKNGYFPSLSRGKLNFSLGLLFRQPLFNGHRTRYEQTAARANLESARERTADVRRKITAEVRQALLDVHSSLSKIGTTDVQISQAEQAVAMANTRYDAGVITNVELLDAQTALLQTRLIRLRALYDYSVGLVALDRATGRRIW